MTYPVLGKLIRYGTEGRSRLNVEDLLKVQAHRPRPEDSSPTGFRGE
jgi:hypothetical protein